MPKFEGNVLKVSANKDRLEEMSELAAQIYAQIREMAMTNGTRHKKAKEEALEKCVKLYQQLGGKVVEG